MTQTFQISDVLRCLLMQAPRGINWACSRESCTSKGSPGNTVLWRKVLTQRKDRVTLVWWKGVRLGGLVSARTRNGQRAWEVDYLYLPGESAAGAFKGATSFAYGEGAALELLEELIQVVGWRSGERIFLRLSPESPIIPLARRVGFFPYFQETLLEGWGGRTPSPEAGAPIELRQRRPQDQFALFQLFSAATPARPREVLGLTFDQWHDAQEKPCRDCQELVAEHQGRITGWLRLSRRDGATEGELMAHPDRPELLPHLLRVALARPGWQRWWLPDYQERLAEHLQSNDFQGVARYTMFIKTVAAPVSSPGMAPVEA
jgi:hypothetical protein